jgi:hypothetical protein
MPAVIEDFRPLTKNTLRGFVRVRFPSGMIIDEIEVHVLDGHAWAAPPSRVVVDATSGTALLDADGELCWQPLIRFANENVRDSWSAQIIAALHEALRGAVPEPAP